MLHSLVDSAQYYLLRQMLKFYAYDALYKQNIDYLCTATI